MKEIYIVISYTGTVLSKSIRLYTKNKYTHVSIALDKELEQLYSFGRLNPYNPFHGGFVHEGIDIGTFKRFKSTESVIYSKEVTDEQYKKVKDAIIQIEKNRGSYKFNIMGMFFVSLKKKLECENAFYCAEFVRYVLKEGDIDISKLPELISPSDFNKLEGLEVVYEGVLREYPYRTRK